MSEFHIFVGGQEVGASEAKLDMTLDVAALGDTEWRPKRDASASFTITDPAWAEVQDWESTRRSIRLHHEVVYDWSRWRRWLNAVLRFVWWPVGPARLPESFTATLDLPEMRVTRVSGGDGYATVVEMTTEGT